MPTSSGKPGCLVLLRVPCFRACVYGVTSRSRSRTPRASPSRPNSTSRGYALSSLLEAAFCAIRSIYARGADQNRSLCAM